MRRRVLIVALSLACIPHSAQAFLLAGPVPARPPLCLRLSAPALVAYHAGGSHAIAAGHTLERAAIEKYLTGGFKEKAVASHGTHGRNAMPLFAEWLSEAEVGLVAAYVIRSAEDGWD